MLVEQIETVLVSRHIVAMKGDKGKDRGGRAKLSQSPTWKVCLRGHWNKWGN
jgi:hypothetical protein